MLIKIEQRHINVGRGGCYNCPGALAIKEVVNEEFRDTVRVYGSRLLIGFDEEKYKATHPIQLHDFVTNWDQELPVQPCEFELNIPPRFLRADDQRE